MIYAYAKTSRYADLEEFVSSPNHADVGKIGDRYLELATLDYCVQFSNVDYQVL